MAGLRVELGDLRPIVAQLDKLKRTLRNRILRQAMVKAARIMAKAVKQNAPKEIGTDTYSRARAGQLKRSIGFKVSTSKNGVVTAIAGPRRGFRIVLGARIRGKNTGKAVAYDPVKTAHLVEFGSVHAAAKPFIRPAMEASRDAVIEAIVSTIQAGIERLGK